MHADDTTFNFLQGGGEMGKLIESYDWNTTPLGDLKNWPQTLKTMVNVMLNTPYSMCIVWGKESIQIYNDSYSSTLGLSRYSNTLGNGAKAIFAENWHDIGSSLNSVMNGNSIGQQLISLPIYRNNTTDNYQFQFTYSPIRLATGEIGGVLITVQENSTERNHSKNIDENNDSFQKPTTDSLLTEAKKTSTTTTYFPEAWFKLTGMQIEQLLDFGWLEQIHPDDREQHKNIFLKAFENKESFTDEFRVLNSEGEYRWLLVQGPPSFETDGTFAGYISSCIDITDQKTFELELQESKDQLEFAIAAAELGTWDYNPLTNIFTANDRLKDWFGLPNNNEIELTDAINAIKENDRERVATAIQNSLEYATGGSYDIEFRINHLINKKETILHAKGRAWFNDNNIAYRLNGTLEDVTTRVLAREKVEESETRYHNLIQSSPSAIAILSGEDLVITIANDTITEYWGKGKDVIGKPYFELLPEMVDQGYVDIFKEVYKTGNPFTAIEIPLYFLQHGEMSTKYYNFIIYPQRDFEENINGLGIIATEVTSQALLNNKIKESEQNIRALVESAPFPIAVYVGDEMLISLANQSIMDAWGKGNDVVGKLYSDILPELGNQQIFNQVRSVFHTGTPFHAKNQRVDLRKDDELKSFYFNYSFTPLFNESGNVYAVMNTAAEVTELHEAKIKVEESEKRFRRMVMQAPLGITIFRGKNHIVEIANKSYLEIIEKTKKQFIGKPLFETLPEVKDVISPIIADIYKTGDAYHGYEFPVVFNRHGKSETKYFNFVYHPLKEKNTITGIMAVATEVTEMVKAKHVIEESEEKLSLIIEASELGVFDVDLKTDDIIASKRCYEILGFYGETSLTHEDMVNNIHPDDLEMRKEAFETAFKEGTLRYQSRVLRKDQSIHWIDAKGKVFYDENNKPERLLGTVRDITEERNFQQQLLEREEKFRLLADSMPQFVWTSDAEGNLNYFNKSVFDYSGLTPEKVYKDGWIQIVHPDDREENIKLWTEAISTGKDFLLEHRFRNSIGEYRWQLSRAIPQKDSDGTIKMWVGTSTDIQEQKMFTNELENMVQLRTNELQHKNVDLEKMNKELQSFVYISSHDLQEPLRKIQIFASRILETDFESLSERAKHDFTRMQKSAFRMQSLIQDLLAYSRTKVEDITYEIVNLHEVIEDVQETLSEELKNNKVTLDLNIKCKVKIIPIQFKQIIHNLISNSIKFAKEDHPLVIKIDCEHIKGKDTAVETLDSNKKYCHIRFADNGIGFEQQFSEKIFEVFQRLHSNDEYTGTGIGLAIVKKIIENHKGHILAKSTVNEGAVFHIYIPA